MLLCWRCCSDGQISKRSRYENRDGARSIVSTASSYRDLPLVLSLQPHLFDTICDPLMVGRVSHNSLTSFLAL